ncbi:MAG: DUF2000 family protein [Acidimicrobiales bacterium]
MIDGWKVAVAVRHDLAPWQALNVTAFVVSGLGTAEPGVIGKDYVDGSGRSYPPMIGLPIRVFAGDGPALRRAFDRATGRDLLVSVYIDELFATMDDEANRAAVAAVPTAELELSGFAVAGPARQIDKALDRLTLHP